MQKGLIFLKTQHRLVVQFHERRSTNTTRFMSVKCSKEFSMLETTKVEGKELICTVKISLFPDLK